MLRDRAAVADGWQPVVEVADELRAARPDMAALHNRINRALARAGDDAVDADEQTDTGGIKRTPSAAVAATQRTLVEAVHADERAAQRAAALLESHATVGTLSRSGTVIDAFVQADSTVVIGESRPAGEGGDVAAALADRDMAVTLTTDAALSSALSGTAELSIDVLLVGADAVLPDSGIINTVGTWRRDLGADVRPHSARRRRWNRHQEGSSHADRSRSGGSPSPTACELGELVSIRRYCCPIRAVSSSRLPRELFATPCVKKACGDDEPLPPLSPL